MEPFKVPVKYVGSILIFIQIADWPNSNQSAIDMDKKLKFKRQITNTELIFMRNTFSHFCIAMTKLCLLCIGKAMYVCNCTL
jgi:hypothetical protein